MNIFHKKINISFVLILFSCFAFSQSNNPDNHYHTEGILSTGNTGTGSNINVVYHRCNWSANPDDATKTLTGSVTTYFKTIAANVATISFDFNNISFNNAALNVTYHNTVCTTIFPNTGNVDVLNIVLPTSIANYGTLDSLTINYEGTPPAANGSAEGFQRKTDANGNNYIYTLSESYEDKDWWPCKADMQDKIDSIDINVTVPNAFWVAANGAMIDSTDDGVNRFFKFKHRYPIASYLVCLGIAKYKRFYLGDVAVGSKNVPFIVNMFSGKTATTENAILLRMNNNKLVFAALNNLYGDYPFANEKHGYYEFGFNGGMEHQTFSGIGTSSMQSNTVLAHELGHQWWGDKVTFATWNHLWLAEGFATYSEALAFEFVPSIGISAVNKMASNKLTAQGNNATPILINNISNSNNIWTNNNTTAIYERGCMVASMLRALLGDTKFFAACKNYLNDPLLQYQSATTADLQRNMENQFGENMSSFFTEWITKKGTPDYVVEWGNVGNSINIKLAQTIAASGISGVKSTFFPMPVVIKIADASGTMDTTIVIYHKSATQLLYAGNGVGVANTNIISYNLSFTPATLTFDPLNQTMANGSINYSAILPIKNINLIAANKINKNIITATIETTNRNENIILEKSIDGIHFEKLGVMNLLNSFATTQQYQLFDDNITAIKVYYRAKINDNGKTIYSKIIAIENNKKATILISPNPAKNVVNISLKNGSNAAAQIKLFNAESKLLLDTITTKNNTSINTSNFADGIYIVEILQNGKVVASEQLVIKK